MKKLKKICLVIACIVPIASSTNAQSEEIHQTIMDCASSAIVEEVIYSGNGDFSFTLRSSRNDRNLTDQNEFGERTRIVLKFNADTLNGTQVVVYPENKVITSDTFGLTGKNFLNLLISRMQTQTPINLTFSVEAKENADLETEEELEIVYFQVNGE